MKAAEFSSLVQKTSISLKPIALNLTRDSDDAKDLMQETLLKALTNYTKFKPGTNLKAWLYTIMRNTFINNYNKVTKRQINLDTTKHFQPAGSGTKFTTTNEAGNNFIMKDITSAISSLTEEFRTPFLMYYVGYKYLEIADKLRLPLGTVKNRIHMARKQLKTDLAIYAYDRD